MNLLTTLAAFLVTLGILVIVHEYGHYWAARRCGVRVLRFSVGFGKPWLTRTDRFGTEWTVAPIPLGGYVSMLDERQAPVDPALLAEAFNRKSVGQKLFVIAAGPVANLLLAVLLYAAIALAGGTVRVATIDAPQPDSAAARAGMVAGEEIVAVGDRLVEGWSDLRWQLMRQLLSSGGSLAVVARSGEQSRTYQLDVGPFRGERLEGDIAGALGLSPQPMPLTMEVESVAPGSPAERAGLKIGDRILSVDGETLADWRTLAGRVRASPGRVLELRVDRGGVEQAIMVTPESVESDGGRVGRLGLMPRPEPGAVEAASREVRHGPLDSLWAGAVRTWDTSVFSVRMMGRMLVGDVSPRNLSGPITIADYAGQSARLGWVAFVGFLALVSISLGVLNLMPVPLLDGGHIMYHLAEFATGRPVPERVMEIGQRVGIAALGLTMLLAFYNDIQRLLTG